MQFILIILLFFGALFLYGTVAGPLAYLFGMLPDSGYAENSESETRVTLFARGGNTSIEREETTSRGGNIFPQSGSQVAGVGAVGNNEERTAYPTPKLNRSGVFEGALTLTGQGFAFRPCGSDVWYWLSSSQQMGEVTSRYHMARGIPLEQRDTLELRAIFSGVPISAPRTGSGSEYARAFRVDDIYTIDANRVCPAR